MEPTTDDTQRRGNPALGLAAVVAGAAHRKRANGAQPEADAGADGATDDVHAHHPFFRYYGQLPHQVG